MMFNFHVSCEIIQEYATLLPVVSDKIYQRKQMISKTFALINSAIYSRHIKYRCMIRLYAQIIRQAVVDHFRLCTSMERFKQEKREAYLTLLVLAMLFRL